VWNKIIFGMKRIVWLFLLFATGVHGQQSRPLKFQEEIHDFGYVNQVGGPVTYSFQFANTSNRPIKILSVQASCGCTTPDWTKEPVEAGGSGFVQASFEPKGRPGYFNKSLTVTTDFDSNPIILQIKGQVSNGLPSEAEFRTSAGSWRLKTSSFNLGKVLRKDEFAGKEFPVFNGGDQPVAFVKTEGPRYITAEVIPPIIQPGKQGKIRILYNGKMRDAYGFQSDRIDVYTDDASVPVKSFAIYATLEDYFPLLSRDELDKAPALNIAEKKFDLGKIKQHQESTHQLMLYNTGRSKLTIRAVQPNCECVSITTSRNEIKPGDEATMVIAFSPQDRLGTQQKSVTVYSDDPQNPVQRITFTAYVED
jgi:hypothetical protein